VQVVPSADHDTIYQAEVVGEQVAQWLLGLPASE
jgi:hypothetical protein